MNKKKILIFFGTRPEFLKLFPLIKYINKYNHYNLKVANTKQHSYLLDEHLSSLKIKVHHQGKFKKFNDLSKSSIHISKFIVDIILKEKPDLVIYQGDTLTAMLSAFHANLLRYRTMHIEAGLRTNDFLNPWPEESFRKSIANYTNFHCCPTKISFNNLRNENFSLSSIRVTGNTIVDTLNYVTKKFVKNSDLDKKLKKEKYVYITIHRRENINNLIKFCSIINKLANDNIEYNFIWPTHSNPSVVEIIKKSLVLNKNIKLIRPLSYVKNLTFIKNSSLIITDSGGIQEEVASFQKKIIIFRKVTERPEILYLGGLLSNSNNLIRKFNYLKKTEIQLYKKNPFGNGKSSQKIYKFIQDVI